jgi:hypothetical protein
MQEKEAKNIEIPNNSPESFYNGIARFFMEVISCDC